ERGGARRAGRAGRGESRFGARSGSQGRAGRSRERRSVGVTRQLTLRVEVRLRRAGLRVRHPDRVLDVREGPVEDPVVAGEGRRVENLYHELVIRLLKEPEGPRVRGQLDGGSAAVGALIHGTPVDFHPKSAAVQAESPGPRNTGTRSERISHEPSSGN